MIPMVLDPPDISSPLTASLGLHFEKCSLIVLIDKKWWRRVKSLGQNTDWKSEGKLDFRRQSYTLWSVRRCRVQTIHQQRKQTTRISWAMATYRLWPNTHYSFWSKNCSAIKANQHTIIVPMPYLGFDSWMGEKRDNRVNNTTIPLGNLEPKSLLQPGALVYPSC